MGFDDIQVGKYRHYKTGKIYEVLGVGRHSETHEEMVIYKALYHCNIFGTHSLWVRPKKMFLEKLTHNGEIVSRFTYVEIEDQ